MTQIPVAPLIARQILFGNPDKALVRLSPDGRTISYLAPLDGVLNVWVGPAEQPADAEPVTHDTGRGIRFYTWAYTNNAMCYLQDQDGDENWRVYSVNLDTGQTECLTPAEGVHAQIEKLSWKFPGEVIIGLNDRQPEVHDLYHVNIRTGTTRQILENTERLTNFVFDERLQVRVARKTNQDGGFDMLTYTQAGNWEFLDKIALEDSMTSFPVGFDSSGEILYVVDSRDRDTAALFAWRLETGERLLLAEDGKVDVGGEILIHPTERRIQAVALTSTRKTWRVLDEAIAEDLRYLATIADGELEIVSRTLDDTAWIAAYTVDNGPLRYYRYNRPQKDVQFLFTNRQDLEQQTLASMSPVVVPTRDSLNLVCYYTLPAGSDDDHDGIPATPLPMVLSVHGGPWSRDYWGYNPRHQWLANRGYAVLSVNFRGSTGFGKMFLNAGNLEWAAKMHDDLIDAVNWAVAQGIADPHRVAIMGGSYGGYATLVGLTFTPEIFACGVDLVGPSNLITLLETMPPYWKPDAEMLIKRMGDHRTEEGRAFLTSRSPLTYAARIQRPLLIGQGANDPRVKQAESDQIVQAMRDNAIPVTYVLYPDEGHGLVRPENRMSFFAIAEAFLATCLGGRYEPVGHDFEGSRFTIPVGIEAIPGLSEAL